MRRATAGPAAAVVVALSLASGGVRATEPARVFEQRCARCHDLEKVTEAVAARPAATREAEVAAYLERHFPPDVETRRALAAWLAERAAGR